MKSLVSKVCRVASVVALWGALSITPVGYAQGNASSLERDIARAVAAGIRDIDALRGVPETKKEEFREAIRMGVPSAMRAQARAMATGEALQVQAADVPSTNPQTRAQVAREINQGLQDRGLVADVNAAVNAVAGSQDIGQALGGKVGSVIAKATGVPVGGSFLGGQIGAVIARQNAFQSIYDGGMPAVHSINSANSSLFNSTWGSVLGVQGGAVIQGEYGEEQIQGTSGLDRLGVGAAGGLSFGSLSTSRNGVGQVNARAAESYHSAQAQAERAASSIARDAPGGLGFGSAVAGGSVAKSALDNAKSWGDYASNVKESYDKSVTAAGHKDAIDDRDNKDDKDGDGKDDGGNDKGNDKDNKGGGKGGSKGSSKGDGGKGAAGRDAGGSGSGTGPR